MLLRSVVAASASSRAATSSCVLILRSTKRLMISHMVRISATILAGIASRFRQRRARPLRRPAFALPPCAPLRLSAPSPCASGDGTGRSTERTERGNQVSRDPRDLRPESFTPSLSFSVHACPWPGGLAAQPSCFPAWAGRGAYRALASLVPRCHRSRLLPLPLQDRFRPCPSHPRPPSRFESL